MAPLSNEATALGHTHKLNIQYPSSEDGALRWRKIAPLIVTDGEFIGAADLSNTLYKTFRRDRITAFMDEETGDRLDPEQVEQILAGMRFDCPPHQPWDIHMAAAILSAMMCEMSALKLAAQAARLDPAIADQMILDFMKRDGRHQLPNRFIPWGDRKSAWPIVKKALAKISPEFELLPVFARSILVNAHTPKRFEGFMVTLKQIVRDADASEPELAAFVRVMNRGGQ